MTSDQRILGALRIDPHFNWRGKDVSRLEGFSDAVFALMLALLAVASIVPQTGVDLLRTMEDFFAFTLTFAVLIMIWLEHYLFFRRYGLRDGYSIFLNSVLLLLVLFYVYPLKFLTMSLIRGFLGIGTGADLFDSGIPAQTVMLVYSAGYGAVFLIFTLLYVHAWRVRGPLGLNEAERELTRCGIRSGLIHVGFGTSSILLAVLLPRQLQWAGMLYFLVGPVMFVHGFAMDRSVRRAIARDGAPEA